MLIMACIRLIDRKPAIVCFTLNYASKVGINSQMHHNFKQGQSNKSNVYDVLIWY